MSRSSTWFVNLKDEASNIVDHSQIAVLKCKNLTLKAIYSRSISSAEGTAKEIPEGAATPDLYANDAGVGKTYHDLLLREDIQAVIIALPILSQPEFIEAALTAGKNVLAEKPIAKDLDAGKKLVEFYNKIKAEKNVTLAIAENFRFVPSFKYAREEGAKLGKVTHFSIRVFSIMDSQTKWYNTEWRKKPEYQGGFLLDGGVHWAAVSRGFLTGESKPDTVQAFTDQVQAHLPPIDSVNAVIKTKSGASGSFQHSAGTHLRAFEWDIGYEKGSVRAHGETVTITVDGKDTVKEFERNHGVPDEVAAWAQSIIDGKPDLRQTPEEALADLEFLEKMFKSGEQNGTQQKYEFQ